jgi:type IV secretion system protein TrbL
MRTILFLFLSSSIAAADTLTHYAYPGDSSPDSNSARGIGAFSFDTAPGSLVAGRSVALTPAAAQKYNVTPGQSFSITANNGSSYNLEYDDVIPTGGPGQQPKGAVVADLYDPGNTLGGGNNFSAQITSVDNGPVLMGSGVTNTGVGGAPSFSHSQTPPFLSALLSKFKDAGRAWAQPIRNAATSLFWILALISLAFTGIWLALKHSDLMEICAELVRYILFTGFFWWLLTSAPDLPGKIIASLWQVGGQASGTGNEIFPGDLVTIGMGVLNGAITHIVWYRPETIVIPVAIALIIFIMCVLIAANVVFLLCAAWVVLFAGMIFLGFGGCRWTSDMAIHYYRTILGIGVSLMTLLLIVGVGTRFLQDLVTAAGQTPDIPSLATLMGAAIVLAIICHKLPKILSEIATGGGWSGHVGGFSVLSLVSLASLAGRGVTAATSGPTVMSSHEKLQHRLAVLSEKRNGQ